jgi:hypothetical protein
MKTVRASSTGYYSVQEALRAAEQLIQLLQSEHEHGHFQLEDVTLQAEDAALVFAGEEYLAFALRGVQEAIRMVRSNQQSSAPAEPFGGS